jgi:hypothetical protein
VVWLKRTAWVKDRSSMYEYVLTVRDVDIAMIHTNDVRNIALLEQLHQIAFEICVFLDPKTPCILDEPPSMMTCLIWM